MKIKIEDLKTIGTLPSKFSSPMEKQEYYSIILHNESMIRILNDKTIIDKIDVVLDTWKSNKEINVKLYLKWKDVLLQCNNTPEILIEKSELMQQLRSCSPFSTLKKDEDLKKQIFNKVFSIKLKEPKSKTDNKKVSFMNYA